MQNLINDMKNIKEGFVATRNNIPVFVYNNNSVVEFTDESRQYALDINGKNVKADVSSYFPDGKQLAKIIEENIEKESLSSFTGEKKAAFLMYVEIRRNPNCYFLEIWDKIKIKLNL